MWTRWGISLRKLPDRVWRLPRREDDEAAEEGIGRILALSDGVFAPYIAEITWIFVFPLTRLVFVWFFAEEHEQPG